MEQYIESPEQEQGLRLEDYIRILYQGRWLILAAFLIVLLVTAYYTFTSPPVYEATATILVEDEPSMEGAIFNAPYINNQSTLLTNQIEILKSRSLAEKVVLALEAEPYRDSLQIFQPMVNGNYMVLRDQVTWILGHLVVAPRADTDFLALTFSASSPYEAATIVNVIAETFQGMNRDFNRSEFQDLRQFLEFQLRKKHEELRKSEEILRGFQESEKLVSIDAETTELITRLATTQANLEATTVSLEASLEQKRNLEKQLEERRSELASEVSQISSPLLSTLQQDYARRVGEKVKYEALIAEDQNIDPKEYEAELRSQSNRIQAVQQRLQEEAQRIANTSMISDPLQITQNLIESIFAIETEIKGFRAKVDVLRDILSQYEGQLEQIPGQGLALARLQRQVQVDRDTYILLNQRLEETKIAEAGQKDNIRIIDPAIEPRKPISPRVRLNLLLGALMGLALGVGLAILLEFMDDSIKNPEELERLGFGILAIIPQITQHESASTKFSTNGHSETTDADNIEARLITHFDPKSPISEAYRTLRTNIQFKKMKGRDSTILVTSSAPKEGKSTTIANLAIAMAQMGTKTVIVDTDLRRPVIHSIFSLKKDKGITNYLMGKLRFDDIIKPTIIDNLYIITSGPLPPNPSELLSSEAMDEFLEEAKANFDLVLFDSPPIIAVTDAAILSTKVDGVITVVRAHQTERNAVRRAKDLLDNVNATIFGCLLNGVNADRAYGSYYYHYYHYYSYYGHDLKRRKKGKPA